ncbi:MAG: hypothetical protein ACJAYG_001266 [Oceanicoccus sp.]|jgi:hypothetical protein
MKSISETNALFVATLPYPSGVRQCRIAAEAAAQASVVVSIAVMMTIGVYDLVALIVELDDIGM